MLGSVDNPDFNVCDFWKGSKLTQRTWETVLPTWVFWPGVFRNFFIFYLLLCRSIRLYLRITHTIHLNIKQTIWATTSLYFVFFYPFGYVIAKTRNLKNIAFCKFPLNWHPIFYKEITWKNLTYVHESPCSPMAIDSHRTNDMKLHS